MADFLLKEDGDFVLQETSDKIIVAITTVDPTTLGYRPMLPAFALNGLQNPVEPGGMTPSCHQVPDVLTG